MYSRLRRLVGPLKTLIWRNFSTRMCSRLWFDFSISECAQNFSGSLVFWSTRWFDKIFLQNWWDFLTLCGRRNPQILPLFDSFFAAEIWVFFLDIGGTYLGQDLLVFLSIWNPILEVVWEVVLASKKCLNVNPRMSHNLFVSATSQLSKIASIFQHTNCCNLLSNPQALTTIEAASITQKEDNFLSLA